MEECFIDLLFTFAGGNFILENLFPFHWQNVILKIRPY